MPFSNKVINKLPNIRILVIGDMMLDHYIWGDVFRISPEAPVPVIHVERDTYTAGGAANVALNLANLGVNTTLIGYCGNDEAGNRLHNILEKNNVLVLRSASKEHVPTIIKTRVVVRNQQLCRIDRESKQISYCIETTPGFEKMLNDVLMQVQAVIISDYAKGVITQSLVNSLFAFSKKN